MSCAPRYAADMRVFARVAPYILLSSALIGPLRLEAQVSSTAADSVFKYLGFAPGMAPDAAIGLIRRRDGTPVDRSWCKPRLLNKRAIQECYFSYARHSWGGLQMSVLINADSAFHRLSAVLVALSVPDTMAAERKFGRVEAAWSASGRKVHRVFARSRCQMHAWVEDRT